MIKKAFKITVKKDNVEMNEKFCIIENKYGQIINSHSYNKIDGWVTYTGWKYNLEVNSNKLNIFHKMEEISESETLDEKLFSLNEGEKTIWCDDGYQITLKVTKISNSNKPTVYVGNGFAPSMIMDSARIKMKTISEEEFTKGIENAHSIVGHPEISKEYSIELNREEITLHKGDILYVVSPLHRPAKGEVVANGGVYKYIPKSEGHKYCKIEVL